MSSEHRHATIVCADVSGFTTISENFDPERVTDAMNRCFEILEDIVIDHGGTVDAYLGDCVVAVFGLEGGAESPPRLAVEASVEIREAISVLNEGSHLPVPLDVHVGVSTGEVIAHVAAGAEAKRQLTMTGACVRLATALSDAAGKGRIFVGPQTRDETVELFEYAPADPVVVRDRDAPVSVHEFIAAKPGHHRVGHEGDRCSGRGVWPETSGVKALATERSERRQATVLFADMSGFKEVADDLGPAAAMDLLAECFEAVERIVLDYGGVVDKYIGECVMALFGVPKAIENAPQQAINAAIEIRNRLAALHESGRLPVPIHVRVGINSGLVIAGEIGGRVTRDFTVMGDTVNVASRLKDASPLGSIYVGVETHRYAQEAFEYRTLDALRLAGKAEPVAVHEVLSDKARLHRAVAGVAERTIGSGMVGRDAELDRLLSHVARLTEGVGSIVSLIGEAGLGKSRLLAEVLARSELQGVTVLVGRSTATGANLSFHPFIDLFRQWAEIAEEDDEVTALEKLGNTVKTAVGDDSDEILPFVATVMGLPPPAAAARRIEEMERDALEKLVFKSVRELVSAIARARPVMLVFEDLHWADESSVVLLEALLRLVSSSAVVVLGVFRPDDAPSTTRIVSAARHTHSDRYDEIHLAPLGEQHCALLAENLLDIDDLPLATRQTIIGKAEGNPFYIEEVVRTLIDQGAIEYVDGRCVITEQIETVEIPGTIQEVIMARVDRLDEDTRHLVQLASVIGRTFSRGLMVEILRQGGQQNEDLTTRLEQLSKKQILVEQTRTWGVAVGERTVVDEIECVFKHALAQQTIYESLLQRTRKQLHGSVAHTIETAFSERISDFYGMLAYHFSRAEQLDKAEEYLFKAGEDAARAAASSEALNLFKEASRLYLLMNPDGGDPHKRMLLEKNIALAHWNKGNLTESIEHFNRTLEYLGEGVPGNQLALYARFVVDLLAVLFQLYVRGVSRRRPRDLEYEKLVFEVLYNRSRAQATSEDSMRMFIDNLNGIRRLGRTDPQYIDQASGMYATCSGLFAFAGVSFDISRRFLAVAEHARRPNDVRDRFSCQAFRLIYGLLNGDWRPELAIDADLLAEALRAGQLWDVNTYLGLNCSRLTRRGEFAAARAGLEQLAELRDAYGYEFAASNYDGTLAMLLLEERSLEEGLEAVQRYYAIRHEAALRVLALGTRAKLQVVCGDLAGAEASLARGDEIIAAIGTIAPWHIGNQAVARMLCDLAKAESGSSDARGPAALAASSRRVLRIAHADAEQRTEAYRLAGRLCWLGGKKRKAAAWWDRSVAEGVRLGARPELARTYAEIAKRAAEDSSLRVAGIAAEHYCEKARGLFVEMNLEREAAELER